MTPRLNLLRATPRLSVGTISSTKTSQQLDNHCDVQVLRSIVDVEYGHARIKLHKSYVPVLTFFAAMM